MASIYVLEIDGWGEVGPAIAITDAEGFADGTFTLTTAGTPPPATEYGAMIWVQDVSAVVADGYYTLTDVDGFDFTMQALPAEVTVTTAAGLSGLARIEDHFKISDSIPSWVTGVDALARWYPDLLSVAESAGQRIPVTGGIASVDGFDFAMKRRTGMAAVSADTYMLATRGPVVLGASITATATEIVTKSAAPYAGESASSPTGAAQPAWVGTEAIDVRGTVPSPSVTDGVSTYTATHDGSSTWVTRGVLRTFAQSHAESVAVFGAMPTPIGQVVRAYVYPDGHASNADRSEVARGACEAIGPSQALGTAQVLSLASSLLSGHIRTVFVSEGYTDSLEYSPGDGTQEYRVRTTNSSGWSYVAHRGIGALAISRVGSVPESVDAQGIEEWAYTADTLVELRSDFPIIREPTNSTEAPNSRTGFAIDSWRAYSAPENAWEDAFPVRSDGPIGGPHWGEYLTLAWNTDAEVIAWPINGKLCHVFQPVTWARPNNSTAWVPGRIRRIEINPVDAILSILTSTGTGHNGDHDNAPREFGFGIKLSDVDVASFTTIGDRLDAEGVGSASIAMISGEVDDLTEKLGTLCHAYALALVTGTGGDVKLVDMSTIDFDASATLDEGDLVAPAQITINVGAGSAVNSVEIAYQRPWADPAGAFDSVDQTDIIRASSGGLRESLTRIGGGGVSIKAWFAASIDDDSRHALADRWARVISRTNSVVGRITAQVDPGYTGQIGDTVSVTLPAFPNAQDSGGMSGALCRIIDRKHVSRPVGDNPNDEITLLAYGVTSADKPRQWAPSGVVNSVTSKLIFDLESDTYHGPDFTSDATSFTDGSKVDIYSENWSLRSTVSPGTISSTAGNTMTLSVAAAGGSGDVTPNVGDKIALASESDQSVSEAAKWGWLTTSTPGYLWR